MNVRNIQPANRKYRNICRYDKEEKKDCIIMGIRVLKDVVITKIGCSGACVLLRNEGELG